MLLAEFMNMLVDPGWIGPALLMEFITCQMEAPQARRSCASSQSCPHWALPKTRGTERGSRSSLSVVFHVFRWAPIGLCHIRGSVGKMRFLARSPSGRLVAWLTQVKEFLINIGNQGGGSDVFILSMKKSCYTECLLSVLLSVASKIFDALAG